MLEPRFFTHQLLEELPSVPNDEGIKNLVARVVLGDSVAKELLIRHFLLVAKRGLGMILAVYPGYFKDLDDMVAEAALVVVTLVDKIRSGHLLYNPKLLNYVAVTVLHSVNEMLVESSILPVPRSTQRWNWNHGRESPVKFSDEEISMIPSPTTATDFEAREAIDSVICSLIERQIVDLRAAGYMDSDVAAAVGVTQQTVNLLRLNLYQRYVEATQ